MSKEVREVIADWLMLIGAVALFASLFLTWSHQFSRAFLTEFGTIDSLRGVPHNPTAWQVYSTADVVLALLAVGIGVVALVGGRPARFVALGAAGVALAFVLHAAGAAPTNGANVFNPALSVPQYVSSGATAGAGETVAIAGLGAAVVGLLVSFTTD